ncbi:MAG TPA: dNTP triphosphohydrolase [Bacteroidia bacterium]|nr:dNTP triphosphohydrolase [Bacteroidia bacterium]
MGAKAPFFLMDKLYKKSDTSRVGRSPETKLEIEEYRTPFRRDYARLIHSPAFRRLQGKTQLYPGFESDFFRNRLTHSMEVAQVAKSIAIRLNNRFTYPDGKKLDIDLDLVEFAGLAHDLGHPPFGHQGEEALDQCMYGQGGFEGNAQTLRIIVRLEKKILGLVGYRDKRDERVGLNLTSRTIASILKYDNVIPFSSKSRKKLNNGDKPVKGFYESENDIVSRVKKDVCLRKVLVGKFKTLECQIMDIADDIAYSTYDLEDGFKAGFFRPFDLMFPEISLLRKVAGRISDRLDEEITIDQIQQTLNDIFLFMFERPDTIAVLDSLKEQDVKEYISLRTNFAYRLSSNVAENGFLRNNFTSNLVGRFIRGVEFEYDRKNPALSIVKLNAEQRLRLEVLKTFTYEMQICSPKLKIVEYRGKEIVRKIFETLSNDGGHELLPPDFRELYESTSKKQRNRVICDFIAGMTDRYAIEFYGRLTSENPETIFKPY